MTILAPNCAFTDNCGGPVNTTYACCDILGGIKRTYTVADVCRNPTTVEKSIKFDFKNCEASVWQA